MTTISASAVAQLRSRTGVSILACKQALEEAQGDEEKAIEILRKRGIAQAAKKADRDQAEGRVFLAQSEGKAALVFLRCETDFVARDTTFANAGDEIARALLEGGEAKAKTLAEKLVPELVAKLGENISLGEAHRIEAPVIGAYVHSNSKIGVVVGLSAGTGETAKDVAMHAAASNPLYVEPGDVEESVLQKEREIWREQVKREGKPEAIVEKILIGKEKKFREENALLTQAFVKDPEKTVSQVIGAAKVTAYCRIAVGQ